MFEGNREILRLCYDSVEEIRDGYYIVSLNNEFGVVDAGNNIKIPLEFKNGVIAGNTFYLRSKETLDYEQYSSETLEATGKHLYKIEKFDDNAWKIKSDMDGIRWGLMNSSGKHILPCIYSSIYIYRKSGNRVYLNVTLGEDSYRFLPKDEKEALQKEKSFIITDNTYEKVDCYYAEETGIPDVQKVAVSCKKYAYYNYKFKYSIRVRGKVISSSFDDILVRTALKQYGLIETYSKTGDITTKGYIDTDGNEVIKSTSYSDVGYVGNKIFWVKNCNGYGTYSNGQEVIKAGTLDNIGILRSIPIMYTVKDGVTLYIGNDGHAYSNIAQAFPIYKYRQEQGINRVHMYGHRVYVDNNFNRLYKIGNELDRAVESDWVRI